MTLFLRSTMLLLALLAATAEARGSYSHSESHSGGHYHSRNSVDITTGGNGGNSGPPLPPWVKTVIGGISNCLYCACFAIIIKCFCFPNKRDDRYQQ